MMNVNAPTIAARLNRLPLIRRHWGLAARSAVGQFFDLYDMYMVSYVGAALLSAHFFTLPVLATYVASGFFGMFFGVIGFTSAADLVGRRPAFIITLLLYSLATLVGAFSPDATFLIVTRFIAGIGIGAELIIIDTYINEIVPPSGRGRVLPAVYSVGNLAAPVVAVISYLLVPTNILWDGWRWVLVIGSLGALYAWYLRTSLPESARWLESRGRLKEAEKIVAELEMSAQKETGKPLPPPESTQVVQGSGQPFKDLWQGPYRARTIGMMIFQFCQTFGYYGFSAWATTLVMAKGFSLVHSLFYTFLMAILTPVGGVAAFLTLEHIERKWAVVFTALAVAVCGLAFGFASTATLVVISGSLMTFFNNWFSTSFHTYHTEIFPTRARATGAGFTYAWSRLSSVFTSYLIGALLATTGEVGVFVVIAVAMVIAALAVVVVGPVVNRIAVEAIST